MKYDIKKWHEEAKEESCQFMDYPESSISKLFDEIERLETEIDRLQSLNRWIPVREKPDDDTPEKVLCYAPQYHSIEIRWTDTIGEAVTHFMPLPQPPESEE